MEQKELDTLFRCAVGLYGILHVRHLKEVIEHYSGEHGSLTVIKSKNIGKPLKYGFLFVKFLFLYVVCVVIMI